VRSVKLNKNHKISQGYLFNCQTKKRNLEYMTDRMTRFHDEQKHSLLQHLKFVVKNQT
jgi:hypothetical protein